MRKNLICMLLAFCLSITSLAVAEGAIGFTATAPGFGGDVTVTIEAANGKLTNVSIQGDGETQGIGSRAIELMPAQMIEQNSIAVDTISGATVTSTAILTAASDALAQSGMTLTAAQVEAYVPTMKPGTYTGSTYGMWNNYQGGSAMMFNAVTPVVPMEVAITVDEHKILDIKVTNVCDTPGYWEPVVERMVPAIVEYQSLGVDTITGSTVTSSAVLRAAEEALTKAGADVTKMYAVKQPKSTEVVTYDCDVAVVGAGGAGTAAALAASEAGAKVIVFEKTAMIGGISAATTGGIGVGCKALVESGSTWTPQSLFEYLSDYHAGTANNLLVRNLSFNAGRVADWLIEHGYEGMPAFGTTMDWGKGYKKIAKLYEDFILKDTDNMLLYLTRADKLLVDETGKITGVHGIADDGTEVIVNAPAVILADGGFGGNKEMLKEYFGTDCFDLAGNRSSSGDALNMALEVGARRSNEIHPHIVEGAGNVALNSVNYRFGNLTYMGLLQVDPQGYRFMNEQHVITDPLAKGGSGLASVGSMYVVFDQEIYDAICDGGANGIYGEETVAILSEKYNWRAWAISPFGENMDYETSKAIEMKQGGKADSFRELAEQIGVDADVFESELNRYNELCAAGEDKDFGKDALFMKALTKAPYYAIRIDPAIFGTFGGIRIDQFTRVVNEELDPIPGLYAAGSCAGDYLAWPYYDIPGTTQGFAYTSGNLAGTYAAEYVSENK